jgi:hypothetical protein
MTRKLFMHSKVHYMGFRLNHLSVIGTQWTILIESVREESHTRARIRHTPCCDGISLKAFSVVVTLMKFYGRL